jgi:hypothetical protein
VGYGGGRMRRLDGEGGTVSRIGWIGSGGMVCSYQIGFLMICLLF